MNTMNANDKVIAEQELIEATRKWLQKAEQAYSGFTFKMPQISFNLRGTTAGMAFYRKWLIRYNLDLYLANKQDFIDRTVPHELAHLIASKINDPIRIKPHGQQWRRCMELLGVKDITRCHSYDVSQVKQRRGRRERPFVYACSCKEFHLTSNIHRKILMGQVRKCMVCKEKVIYIRTEYVD